MTTSSRTCMYELTVVAVCDLWAAQITQRLLKFAAGEALHPRPGKHIIPAPPQLACQRETHTMSNQDPRCLQDKPQVLASP